MKKYIKILIPTVVILTLMFTGVRLFELFREKKYKNDLINHLPVFELKSLTNDRFTNKDLKEHTPLIFFYFNSECEFCQAEINDVLANIEKFKGIQLIFVSFESAQKIIMFQATNKLDIYDNIIFLSDYNKSFSETFGVKTLPSSLVYDKNGKLVSLNSGAVKVDYLLKALQK